MARTSRAERHRRRESVGSSHSGKGFQHVVTAQMSQWGAHVFLPSGTVVGRKTSFNWALIDAQHLIVYMATSLQRISLRAEEHKQYAAAVGAQKMLYELLLRGRWTMMQPKQVVLLGVSPRQHQSLTVS